jgi:ABC-2 type transport system permease protein
VSTKAPFDPSGYVVPGHGNVVLDVFRYRYLLRLLVQKGIRTRYRGSALGWAWSYVKPASQFLVYWIALGVFLRLNHGVDNFPIYLFSGIVVVNLFSEAFSNATKSIVDNGPLVQKIYLPRELFPLAAVFVAFVHFLPQVAVLFIACLFVGWVPSFAAVGCFLLGAVIVIILATGLGLFFGSINVSFRDAQNVVDLILLFATWASPVLYSWSAVQRALPPPLEALYMINPLTPAVGLFHDAFWQPTLNAAQAASNPAPNDLLFFSTIALLVSIVILVIGQLTFRRLEGRFAQDL